MLTGRARFLVFFVLVGMLLGGLSARAEPLPPVFENALVRYVMTRTKPGSLVLSQVTSTQFELMTESTYSAFLQRMAWQQNTVLREKLGEEFQGLTREFGQLRQQNGRPEALESGEVLSAQEKQFLEQWGDRVLRSNGISDLLVETRNFFVVPVKAPKTSEALRQQIAEGATVAYAGMGETPALPSQMAEEFEGQANASTPALREFDRMFWTRIGDRFRAYRMFFDVLRISEGQWRSLYTLSGRTFTARDLELVRKANRLLDVLNEYSRTRLIMRAFSQESPQVYDLLNEKTADATRDYLRGVMNESDYLALRRKIADEIKMNTIVPEAEKRMIQSVRRLKELGGGVMGGAKRVAQIDLSEDNIELYRTEAQRARDYVAKLERLIREVEGRMTNASGSELEQLRITRRTYEQNLLRERADEALAMSRLRTEAESLSKMYIEFIEAYDSLELFVNLRFGKINSEMTQVFNLPDSLVPSAFEIQEWKNFYDKALGNSTNAMVRGEVQSFYSALLGATRKFVVDMNEWTGKYFGKKFTESPFGREFLQYNKSIVRIWAERVVVVVGLVSPAAAKEFFDRTDVKEYFLDPIVQKLWDAMFQTEDSSAPTARPASSASGSSSSSGSSASGPRSSSPSPSSSAASPSVKPSPSPSTPPSGSSASGASTEGKKDDTDSEPLPPPPSGGPAGGRRIVIGFPHSGITPPKATDAPEGSNPEDQYQ